MNCEKGGCSFWAHLWHRKIEILGGLLVILGSVASLLSFSGLGLFGMLLVGWGLMSRHCFRCHCCHEECHEKECSKPMGDACEVKPVKKVSKAKPKAK